MKKDKDSIPTRLDLIAVLEQLIQGKRDRQSVASWAYNLYSDDRTQIDDQKVTEDYLQTLYGLSSIN